MKHLLILALLSIVTSCAIRNVSIDSNNQKSEKKIVVESFDRRLCYQNIFLETDGIRCPDSISTIQMKDSNLFLTQSFFGSGYGNGIWVNLVKMEDSSITILDSIFWYNSHDFFKAERITFNDTLNWFYYIEQGSGTGDYSEIKHFISIEDNRFKEICSFPKYASYINVEESPMPYVSINTSPINISSSQIVLKARFESGIAENDALAADIVEEDSVTFEYSDLTKRFEWKSSTNAKFKDFWTGEENIFELDFGEK